MSKLADAIAAMLESSINRYIALDPDVGQSLTGLQNRSVTLRIKEFSFPVYFKIENQRIKVLSSMEEPTDVSLIASVPTLISMTVASSDDTILGSDIEMTGNMDVGRQFRDIFKNLDIDWEEVLSKYTGDIVAHKLGNGARQFNRWLGSTNKSIQQDISEYLQEESQQLPVRQEVEGYIKQVDNLRLAVERAEARIKLIKTSSKEQ